MRHPARNYKNVASFFFVKSTFAFDQVSYGLGQRRLLHATRELGSGPSPAPYTPATALLRNFNYITLKVSSFISSHWSAEVQNCGTVWYPDGTHNTTPAPTRHTKCSSITNEAPGCRMYRYKGLAMLPGSVCSCFSGKPFHLIKVQELERDF